jgi:hypothetical protein
MKTLPGKVIRAKVGSSKIEVFCKNSWQNEDCMQDEMRIAERIMLSQRQGKSQNLLRVYEVGPHYIYYEVIEESWRSDCEPGDIALVHRLRKNPGKLRAARAEAAAC